MYVCVFLTDVCSLDNDCSTRFLSLCFINDVMISLLLIFLFQPADCKALIERLKNCSEEELYNELTNIKTWTYGKVRFLHIFNFFLFIFEF